MSTEEAFLREALERPDDDEVRLVYADWLLDQGDPRGELMHVQIALARGGLAPERAAELNARELRLLDEHGAAWKAPFRERGWQVEFRRGLPAVPLPRRMEGPGVLARVRPPRVRIGYDVPLGPMELRELPFVIGVIADLSGHNPERKPLAQRRFRPIDRDNFDQIMQRLRPELHLSIAGEEASLAFERVEDFAPGALEGRVPEGLLPALLSHPDFQRLAAAWRGLHYLVFHAETSHFLKIRVLDARKDELRADRDSALEFDLGALFDKVYRDEHLPGGEPYCLLAGDYEFAPTPDDLRLLRWFAQVAAASTVPFVAAASPEFSRRDHLPEWAEFRAADESSFVALTVPRVPAPQPSEELPRDELLMSAAWAFAARVADAVARHGWPAHIWGPEGGRVEELPCPGEGAEVAFAGRQARELTGFGLLPLSRSPGRQAPAFLEARSCGQGPASRLDHLLCASRFAHYVRVMARDMIHSFTQREDCEAYLNRWLANHVGPPVADDPGDSPLVWYYRRVLAASEARFPLAEGRVELREAPGRPGSYRAALWLRPSFQCAGAPTIRLECVLYGGPGQ